jgi:riboflavin kinase/FMN adenylyltransferase
MQVHTNIEQLPIFRNAVVTIGTFDGVHRGHQKIIEQLKTQAQQVDGETVIITFHPHPRRVVAREQTEIKLLNTLSEKEQLLQSLGIDHLVIVPFDESFANQHATDYIEKFLVSRFHPATIIIGYDHRFGKNREGNYQLLEKYRDQYKYQLIEIPEAVIQDNTISSTRIRKALSHGEIAEANDLLGYHYFFEGVVIQGNKLGRTIGYPTANLLLSDEEKLVPGNGVYAVQVVLPSLPQFGTLNGMMNIGVRPTVDGTKRSIEVNIFDFNEDIYDKQMRVLVVEHLRGEQKFEGLEALKNQLAQDEIQSRAILKPLAIQPQG